MVNKVFIYSSCNIDADTLASIHDAGWKLHKHVYETTTHIILPQKRIASLSDKTHFNRIIIPYEDISKYITITHNNNNVQTKKTDQTNEDTLKKAKLLANIYIECHNESDPITLDDFKDLNIQTLETVVKIGHGKNRHCLTLDSAFDTYNNALMNRKKARDPFNPDHEFTAEEIQEIIKLKKVMDSSFTVPKYMVQPLKPSIQLLFIPNYSNEFMCVRVIDRYRVLHDLGVIPSYIEPTATGSTDYSSSVLFANIRQLWDDRKLFRDNKYPFTNCVIDTGDYEKVDDWYNYYGIFKIQQFKTLCENVVDALR